MIVFIILPFVAFFLGMNYGKQMIRPIELIVIPRTENIKEADTSDWQTYRNEAYGFEFSYPKDHTAYADINPKEEILIPATPISDYVAVADDESFLFCCEAEVLSISIERGQIDARDWLDQNLSRYTDEDEIKSIEEVTFAGQNAVEMIAGGNIASTYKLLVIQRGDFLIVINQNSESQFLGEIVSTFRFIESLDTSGWQTYKDEESFIITDNGNTRTLSSKFGIEVTFPSNWIVMDDHMEGYGTLKEAEAVGGNHFALLFDDPNISGPGQTVGGNDIKIEFWPSTSSGKTSSQLSEEAKQEALSLEFEGTLDNIELSETELIFNNVDAASYSRNTVFGSRSHIVFIAGEKYDISIVIFGSAESPNFAEVAGIIDSLVVE